MEARGVRGGSGVLILLVVVLIGAAIAAAILVLKPQAETDLDLEPMVVGLKEMNELTVFSAQVVTVPTTKVDGLIDMMDRSQTSIYSARVRYTIDLSKLRNDSVRWNPANRTMTVTVPAVIVEPAELDGASKRTFRTGPPASAVTWDKFDRSNVIKAKRQAADLAKAAPLLRLAEESGRKALEGTATIFARSVLASNETMKVVVRYAPEGEVNGERWDQSRNMQDVLAERR